MERYFWQENIIPHLVGVHTIIFPYILVDLCTETNEQNMKRAASTKFEL